MSISPPPHPAGPSQEAPTGADSPQRSALVTGGSAGIGLAIAQHLLTDGWRVTIVGRNEERLAAAAGDVHCEPQQFRSIAADLSKDVAASVVGGHLETFGSLELLVNNAGVGLPGAMASRSTRHLDLELGLNLRTPYRMMQEALPALRDASRRHGASHVINVSSQAGRETPPFVTGYAATKAGLIALSRSAHAELSPDGVHVCALLPGFVDTPGTSWVPDSGRTQMILADDVAEAVRFVLRTSSRCFVPVIELVSAGAGLHEFVDWKSYSDQ